MSKINKFWNFSEKGNERILRIDGAIVAEKWFDDEITPKNFKADLEAGSGNITIWINSPGGDVISAAILSEFLYNVYKINSFLNFKT